MSLLETISESGLIRWVAESDWGYPIVLTAHAIGMGLVVGIQLMFDLRVLGVARTIPLAAMRPYFRIAWLGLVVNVISGVLLFFVHYDPLLHNVAFGLKLSLLLLAAIATWMLARDLFRRSDVITRRTQLLASVCVLLWFSAIIAGRIVGYTSAPTN